MGAAVRTWRASWVVAVPLVASAIVQAPILGSYFYGDDFFGFVRIHDAGCFRYAVAPYAGHLHLVPRSIMCAEVAAFGMDPVPFFAWVLATHLLAVALLFAVARSLTGRRDVACLAATVWGTSALHAETLAWHAVYGHVLSAAALLGALLLALGAEGREDPGTRRVLAACGLLLVGLLSFGTGLALAAATPIVLLWMIPALRRRRAVAVLLAAMPLVAVLLYGFVRWLAGRLGEASWQDQVSVGIALSDPSQAPRLLAHLVRYAALRLVTGAWVVGDPPLASWLVLALYAAVVLVVVGRADGRTRRRVVGTLLLALAAYGIIAVGRANVTIANNRSLVNMARVSRYHYVGSAALVLSLASCAAWLLRARAAGSGVAAILVGAYVAGVVRHPIAFDLRPYSRRVVTARLATVDAALRAVPPGETVVIRNEPLPLTVSDLGDASVLPGTAALVLAKYGDDRPLGRVLRVEEPDYAAREAFRAPHSRWLSRMLVVPRVVPAGDARASRELRCRLAAAKRTLAVVHRLLDCERADAAGGDGAACHDAVLRRTPRDPTACRVCLDARDTAGRVRTLLDVGRSRIRCAADADAAARPAAAARLCAAHGIDALGGLVDRLFACHQHALVERGVLDDGDCERAALRAYRAGVATQSPTCGSCSTEVLGAVTRSVVATVFRRVLCVDPPAPG